jgi:hypothetical protein
MSDLKHAVLSPVGWTIKTGPADYDARAEVVGFPMDELPVGDNAVLVTCANARDEGQPFNADATALVEHEGHAVYGTAMLLGRSRQGDYEDLPDGVL